MAQDPLVSIAFSKTNVTVDEVITKKFNSFSEFLLAPRFCFTPEDTKSCSHMPDLTRDTYVIRLTTQVSPWSVKRGLGNSLKRYRLFPYDYDISFTRTLELVTLWISLINKKVGFSAEFDCLYIERIIVGLEFPARICTFYGCVCFVRVTNLGFISACSYPTEAGPSVATSSYLLKKHSVCVYVLNLLSESKLKLNELFYMGGRQTVGTENCHCTRRNFARGAQWLSCFFQVSSSSQRVPSHRTCGACLSWVFCVIFSSKMQLELGESQSKLCPATGTP